jgi:putative flavoprotein involved in K+ transport
VTTRVDTVVVGAGQAGLALSRSLSAAGHDHVVLDRGRVAERWRSERWDSFRLLTPNWMTRLPGYRYTGPDPDGFMGREEVVRFFDDYARSFAAPLHTGVDVSRVSRHGERWRVLTSHGVYDARNVVIASGHYAEPRRPAVGEGLPGHVEHVSARDYRSPSRLPDGATLVVGSGPTGQQIADEVARSGRRVFLAVGRHRPLPRRYRGADAYVWLDRMGSLERDVDTLPDPGSAANAPSVVLAGGLDDLDLHRVVRNGVVATGRLLGVSAGRLRFADDLAANLAAADEHAARFRSQVDAFLGGTAPSTSDVARPAPGWATTAPTELDLAGESVRCVVWAAGYRRDFSWIDAPVFAANGEPVQRRGVTGAEGLMFLGLRFMHRRNSNFIDGVGADAEFLARRIVGSRLFDTAVA